jgi:hypothetical protein
MRTRRGRPLLAPVSSMINLFWMFYRHDGQPVDSGEVTGVARIEGKVIADGDGGNHGVVGTGRRLAARPAQRCRNLAERACGLGVEGKRIEVGLGLLEVCLAIGLLLAGGGHERPDRQLGERDGGDQGFCWKGSRVGEAGEEDDGARIQQASALGRTAHNVGSTMLSTSARSAAGSTRGSRDHRRRS